MSDQTAKALQKDWQTSARWSGVKRTYTAEDVVRAVSGQQNEPRRPNRSHWDSRMRCDAVTRIGRDP